MINIYQSNQLKAIAVLMMLCLHLFNTLDYSTLFKPVIFIGKVPLIYYISLFCDACIPIFSFVSGYGLYLKYNKDSTENYQKKNLVRIKKLYVNYWIVLILFAVVLGKLINQTNYPGSFLKFFLNFTAINTSYVGAWWFFTTYVLFVVTSRILFTLLDKINGYLFFSILLILYLVAFYFRVYNSEIFHQPTLDWLQRQVSLYFCTIFQFMAGAFFLKYRWDIKSKNIFSMLSYKNLLLILLILLLMIIHAMIPNFIIAPFTGLAFIFIFLEIKKPNILSFFLNFIFPHTTNIWLIHMFIYMVFFKNFIYGFHYPFLIFTALLIICLVSSYIVNFINYRIVKLL
ncbi:acyltransferase family protein [Acinetobacter sp. ANC 4636]